MLDANAVLRFLLRDNEEQFCENLPKLDFVDCLLYGYKMERDVDIVTFGKLLKKQLLDIEKFEV